MFRPTLRVTAMLVALPFWVFAATLAPTHVHETDAPHAHAIVHSHFDAHHVDVHGDESEVEGGDHVVWLDASVLHGTLFHVHHPALCGTRVIAGVSPGDRWSAVATYEGAPAHGPPRCSTSLRAPPFLPV